MCHKRCGAVATDAVPVVVAGLVHLEASKCFTKHKMKEEVRVLIKDLIYASRQSLFNGVSNVPVGGAPTAKRPRTDGGRETSGNTSKSWDNVSSE